MPVIQIVYETLKDIQESKGLPKTPAAPKAASAGVRMSVYDRTPAMGQLAVVNCFKAV